MTPCTYPAHRQAVIAAQVRTSVYGYRLHEFSKRGSTVTWFSAFGVPQHLGQVWSTSLVAACSLYERRGATASGCPRRHLTGMEAFEVFCVPVESSPVQRDSKCSDGQGYCNGQESLDVKNVRTDNMTSKNRQRSWWPHSQ